MSVETKVANISLSNAVTPMSLRAWLALAGLGLIWGSSFLWIKIGVQELGPFTLVGFRLLFGIVGLVMVIVLQRPAFPTDKRMWLFMAILGLTNTALPFTLISWGEQHIDSGVASILNSTVPLVTLVLAHLFLHDERINLSKVLGLVAGFAGVVTLVAREALHVAASLSLWGQVAVLAAVISYAGSSVFARRTLRGLPPLVQAFVTVLSANAAIWPIASVVEAPLRFPVAPLTWVAVAWLGLLGSCAAYLLYFYLIQNVGATRATTVTYFFPVVGALLGVVFLRERFDLWLVAAVLLVVAGVWLTNNAGKVKQVVSQVEGQTR